jgi:hypothetical protein
LEWAAEVQYAGEQVASNLQKSGHHHRGRGRQVDLNCAEWQEGYVRAGSALPGSGLQDKIAAREEGVGEARERGGKRMPGTAQGQHLCSNVIHNADHGKD